MNGDVMAITYSEIVAWQQLTRNELTTSDVSVLEALDVIATQPKGK